MDPHEYDPFRGVNPRFGYHHTYPISSPYQYTVPAKAETPPLAPAVSSPQSPHGLNNLGANCWFNSLLQALLCCKSFTDALIKNRERLQTNRLGKALIEMLDAAPSARSAFPQRLLKEFEAMCGAFEKTVSVYSQEGCQNGFTVFMELLNCSDINDAFINKSHCLIVCQGCGKHTSTSSYEFSIQVTEGYVTPLTKESSTPRTFNDWLGSRVSIVDEWKCEACSHKSTNVARLEMIATLRDVIMVFITDKSKSTYPNTLTFPGKNGTTFRYNLVAGIEHIGSQNPITYQSSGHYKCHGVRDGVCWTFNDSSFYRTNSIPTASCHVIVYHKQ